MDLITKYKTYFWDSYEELELMKLFHSKAELYFEGDNKCINSVTKVSNIVKYLNSFRNIVKDLTVSYHTICDKKMNVYTNSRLFKHYFDIEDGLIVQIYISKHPVKNHHYKIENSMSY